MYWSVSLHQVKSDNVSFVARGPPLILLRGVLPGGGGGNAVARNSGNMSVFGLLKKEFFPD